VFGFDFDELGIQDVVDLLRGDETDLPAILRDFGNRARGEDPVIHFYEHFLSAYNKQLKVQRGVFYTPQPAVSYIVRSVHALLQTEFGLEDGLASTITWGEMAARYPNLTIPAGTDPESPFIVVLDPATGTATFLVEVIDVIYQTLTAKWTAQGLTKAQQRAAWNEYVPNHLLPRLYGYELMMAPYAIAHMKIGLKLKETGYDFHSDARVRIYLTNALEPASDGDPQLQFAEFAPALAHEAQAVNEVKRRVTPTIVIGNPPYAGHSANDSAWVAGLLRGVDAAGHTVENYFEVDGQSLNERNPKYLNDDYVKFIRFGQWRIVETGAGILAFITNHGYLDNPTFRGMRQSLMTDFGWMDVLDLHGSSKKKETTPEGGPDENVFDIMPGVAILLAVRKTSALSACVEHADLYGLRGCKYAALTEHDVTHTTWKRLEPAKPFYLFAPQDVALLGEYMDGWKITDAMPLHAYGFKAHRDDFAIAFDKTEIEERITLMRSKQLSDAEFRTQFDVRDNRDWQLNRARRELRANTDWEKSVILCSYRPFDNRWCYFSTIAMDYPRVELLDHVAWRNNLCLLTSRQQATVGYRHSWIARHPANDCAISTTSREANHVFPLYLYSDPKNANLFDLQVSTTVSDSRRPNFSPSFLRALETQLGLTFNPILSQPTTFTPEDVFRYSYTVFHSPTYRTRYAEFLKIDFPRLPLTSDVGLFRALAGLGADLVALHLLEDDYPAASWNLASPPPGGTEGGNSPLQHPITTFVEGANGTTMSAFSKSACYQDGRVYLDTSNRARSSYFDGVPEDVWNFHIGGYQVLYKWLYDRRGSGGDPGRTLTLEDIAHYQRIVVALKETMRLMAEIDAVIEGHGGWPIG